MRIVLYVCILALLFLAPVERLDVAKLEPVQTVAVRTEEQRVVIETDTQNRGQGHSLHEAVRDLEENTPGVIYLDTAQYLLLTEDAAKYRSELKKYMRPSVKVSMWDGVGNVETAAKYLAVRSDLPRLKDFKPNLKNNSKKVEKVLDK